MGYHMATVVYWSCDGECGLETHTFDEDGGGGHPEPPAGWIAKRPADERSPMTFLCEACSGDKP